MNLSRLFALVAVFLSMGFRQAHGADASKLPPASSQNIDFRRDIFPLLTNRCFGCHHGVDARARYRLDLRAEVLGETDGRVAVKIGDSERSRLIHLVAAQAGNKVMPPKGPRLSGAEIGLLRAWIDQGLAWDDQLLPPTPSSSDHWAFRPIVRYVPPAVKNSAWVRTPVDAFIGARHDAQGLQAAPESSRQTLIRRLSLDLTGLPPTAEETAAFVADPAADAYERVVERLLASPHYGERWGRHWLDLARWAESEGYESDHPRPYAWRYRDYVVASFNQDRPYDRFLREQIAGDEIEPYRDEHLIATGFLAAARLSSNEEDRAQQRNDVLVDVVNAVGSAILGLTISCAQCHNHKFDPITASDYYRLQGFFIKGAPNNLALKNEQLWSGYNALKPPEYDPAKQLLQLLQDAGQGRLLDEAKKQLSPAHLAALDTAAEQRTPEQQTLAREADLAFQFTPNRIDKAVLESADKLLYEELKKKLAALEKNMLDVPQTWGFYSPATSPAKVNVLPMKGFYPPPYVPAELAKARPYQLVSGEVHQRGAALDAGWPKVFGPTTATAIAARPRTALVDWLTARKTPLTARVWANRVWQIHFGRGIVATPSDFGTRGAKPTHPELLDWLATELVASGWSTKHLHRLILLSNTYRQSARFDVGNAKIDPDNLNWWRWPVRRLEAETLRDAMLAVSGELQPIVGGPSDADENGTRRSLYLFQKRNRPPQVQKLFDGPTGVTESCAQRHVSTGPLQALYLLNNEFSLKRAQAFAERLQAAVGSDRNQQVDTAFRMALGRRPDDAERAASAQLLARPQDSGESALVLFCQALLNVNEFAYLE